MRRYRDRKRQGVLCMARVPVYPLDGGQMLRSVLWFRLGPRRSLLIATSTGLVGVAGLLAPTGYEEVTPQAMQEALYALMAPSTRKKFEQNLGEGISGDADLEDADLEAADLEDVVDFRVGLEHKFYNGVPIRFGFRHFTNYVDKDANSTIFTGGTGFPIGTGLVAVSVEIMKITSFQEHQFPYPENPDGSSSFPVEDEARVEDTRFRIGVSYTVNW